MCKREEVDGRRILQGKQLSDGDNLLTYLSNSGNRYSLSLVKSLVWPTPLSPLDISSTV